MKLADRWRARIAKLPPGLTQFQAARKLRGKTNSIRLWLIRFGYPFVDGRTLGWSDSRRKKLTTIWPETVDWSLPMAEIGRRHGVSRQRVFQIRERLGKAKIVKNKC